MGDAFMGIQFNWRKNFKPMMLINALGLCVVGEYDKAQDLKSALFRFFLC